MMSNQESNEKSDTVHYGPRFRAAYITRNYREIVVRPDAVIDAAPAPGPAPYKGLYPFTTADAPLFYGRESITQKLVERLQATHFLALVGASGSGKTSLISAGLTPVLREREWLVHTFTPGMHPLHEVAKVLRVADPALPPEDELVPTLVVNPRALPLTANQLVAKHAVRRLLLVVDQFEELFTRCEDPAERRAFLETLTTAASEKGATTVLIAVHGGFYDRCLEHKGLRTVLARAQEPLAPLTGVNLLRAIAEPARRGGWHFVEGLLEQFLENAGSDPGRLPLVSQALFETWKRRQGTTMTFAGYRAAGGIEGAIAQTAEQALRAVPPEQIELVKQIFITLSTLGEGYPNSGRSVPITELSRLGRAAEVASVVARLARARLLSMDGGRVQLAHESLIAHWPRLRAWLARDQERLRFQQRLAYDAQTWEALGRDDRALYTGARLRHARAWRAESPIENTLSALSRTFLDASVARAAREAREEETGVLRAQLRQEQAAGSAGQAAPVAYRQLGLISAFVLVALAVVLAGAAALHITREAQEEARVARAETLAVRSADALPAEPLAALALAWQAANQTYATDGMITEEARAALLQAMNLPVPASILQPSQAPVTDVAFNPEGDRLLTISLDGSGRFWDVDGNLRAQLRGGGAGLISAGFSRSGERIFTLGQDGIVRIWNLRGDELARIGGPEQRVTSAAFHPDGERLLTAGEDGSVRLWDLAGNELVALPGLPPPISAIHFDPDGDRILAASQNSARLWNLEGVELARFEGHTSGITDATFSPDGERVATASYDRSARVWDLTGKAVAVLQGHEDVVWSVSFSPSGEQIATGGGDYTARVWDLQGNLVARLGMQESGVAAVHYQPQGERLLTITWDGSAVLWDEQGNEVAWLDGSEVNVAHFSPAGERLVTANVGGSATIWELGSAELLPQAEGSRARLGENFGDAYPSDDALWAGARSRLIRSSACADLFDEATCAE